VVEEIERERERSCVSDDTFNDCSLTCSSHADYGNWLSTGTA
jgi:hypothetical protein